MDKNTTFSGWYYTYSLWIYFETLSSAKFSNPPDEFRKSLNQRTILSVDPPGAKLKGNVGPQIKKQTLMYNIDM